MELTFAQNKDIREVQLKYKVKEVTKILSRKQHWNGDFGFIVIVYT